MVIEKRNDSLNEPDLKPTFATRWIKGEMEMSEDITKRLNLMRFWLFGTFVIVFAAITIYIGMFTNRDWMMALRSGLPIWGIVGVLCVVWYYGYKFWVGRVADKDIEEPPAATY